MLKPSITVGAGALLQFAADPRFVLDCKENPPALAGQVRMTFGPDALSVSSGIAQERLMWNLGTRAFRRPFSQQRECQSLFWSSTNVSRSCENVSVGPDFLNGTKGVI